MRHHPNVVVRVNVACQSSRNGLEPHLIVIHDTEGGNVPKSNRDLDGLAAFFNHASTQASAHVGVDQDGNSSRMVPDERKAWACMNMNSLSLNIEQIGFATENWDSKAKLEQLHETARWCAYWNREHGIPLRYTKNPMIAGVIQHRDLGVLGGGHHDVASTYPMAKMLRFAREHRKHI